MVITVEGMVNRTRASQKAKEDENNNSRVRQSSSKASDISGLRRSTRETVLKNSSVPSPSSTQKSEQLDKNTPVTPAKKKSEKQRMPSPLRRSARGKKLSSSSSTGSMETKKRKLDARAYKALFLKKPKKVILADHDKELNRPQNLFEGDHDNTIGDCSTQFNDISECSERKGKQIREEAILDPEVEVCHSSLKPNGITEANLSRDGDALEYCTPCEFGDDSTLHVGFPKGWRDEAEKVPLDCIETANLHNSHLIDDHAVDVTPSQMRRKREETDTHPLNVDTNDEISNSVAGATPSLPSTFKTDLVETCSKCMKSQREGGNCKILKCSCNTERSRKPGHATNSMDCGEHEACIMAGPYEKSNNHTLQTESPKVIQSDADPNTCVICNIGGKLLCCDGRVCKRSYHLSCLDPPLENVPLGAWHCLACVQKKIVSGVHSVSEGMESICDEREEVLGVDEVQMEKQFLVKYKGLAHVHNRWVPESQLLTEAPLLLSKFKRRSQNTRWKIEWTMPHRLLHKRLLRSPKKCDTDCCVPADVILDSHYEWLVKWRGLGYEHSTWEFENASFFNSPEAKKLISEYEDRHEKAKRAYASKRLERKKDSLLKLTQLPCENLPGSINNYLDILKKLQEFWHKNKNAVVFEDAERITSIILFILSMQPDISQPFLIISSSAALDLWEAEFSRLAPSVNVVLYNGNIETRKNIRMLEFFEEDGLMLQVLVSTPEIIVEDLELLRCIDWETIIVDECQRLRTSMHFEQIKMLSTEMRIIVVTGQLKDSISEYLNFLSLLDDTSASNDTEKSKTSYMDTVVKLKERLSRYTVQEHKSDSRFLEFWVPVQLSDMQLEEYCAILSSSVALRSSLKNDQIDAVHDVLINTRKCCDHPYIVDQSLQSLLTKDLQVTEYLDVGIKASGKLQILDLMLSVVKKKGLRTLIIFQPIAGKDSITIGDILDDFLRQRFGDDSYERVDGGLIPSKKQSALNAFNNKESGRFVFLLETRACLPSIKLSSVDIVIIYDSDWNPVNDIRALQRITFDFQAEQIKVFRLYTSCTLEENVLVRVKKELVESNFLNLSWSASHQLLMWGASYLFSKLDEFHFNYIKGSGAVPLNDQDVNEEFMAILAQNGKNNGIGNSSYILRVKNNGATYSTNAPLLGELKIQVEDEEPPHMFWTHLLEGKNPIWKYASVSSQRNRKRVQYFDVSPKKLEVASDEVIRKRKRVVTNSMDSTLSREDERQIFLGNVEGADSRKDIRLAEQSDCEVQVAGCEERRKLRDAQKNILLLVKPATLRLCEILQFSEDVKDIVGNFLEYVMNDHQVPQEPASILQAFQIALCWTASSLLKHKIRHKESFALAKQHLNFDCTQEEVEHVFSKLQCLKSMFLYSSVAKSGKAFPVSIKEEKLDDLVKKDISKSIKRIQKKVKKQTDKLIGKQQEELRELYRIFAEEKEQLEKKHKAESAVVRHCHVNNEAVKIDKLKKLTDEHAKAIGEQKQRKGRLLKELAEKHMAARDKDNLRADCWVKDLKSWAQDLLLQKLCMDDLGDSVPTGDSGSMAQQQNTVNSSANGTKYSATTFSKDDGLEHIASGAHTSEEQISQGCMLDKSDKDVSLDTANVPTSQENPYVTWRVAGGDGSLCLPETLSFIKDSDNVNLPTSQEHILHGEVPVRVPELCSSMDGLEKSALVNPPSSRAHTPDVNVPSIPNEYVHVPDGGQLIVLENEDSLEMPVSAPNEVLSQVPSGLPETVTSNDCSENTVLLSSRALQTPEAMLSMPDKEIPLEVPEASPSEHVSEASPSEHVSEASPSEQVPEASPREQVPEASPSELVPEASPSVLLGDGNVNGKNDGRTPVSSDILNSNTVRQPCGEGNTFSQEDLHLPESSMMNTPSLHPVTCLPQGLGDRSFVMLTSNDISGSEVTSLQVQNTLRDEPSYSTPHEQSQWLPPHAASVATRMHLPYGPDPLQNELEKLRKEMDHTMKIHGDTKLQLKSLCDKEVEELVAQIRKKYEIKLIAVDNDFALKKKTLDANIKKVHMNKILAEAFRSKCMDRAAIASGTSQDVTATFRQQLAQLSVQQHVQRPIVSNAALSDLPAVIPQSASHIPSIPKNPDICPSAFTSTLARPPYISHIRPPTCSVPVGSEIRAPAPHLQPFRPSMHLMPSRQVPNNSPPIPPSLPVSFPRPSPPPPTPPHESGLNHRTHRTDGEIGVTASLPFSSVSTVELLIDIGSRPGANPPSILNSSTNFDQLNHFGPPVTSRMQVTPTQSSETENIVCISDDD